MTVPFSAMALKISKLKFNARAVASDNINIYLPKEYTSILSHLHVGHNILAGEMSSRGVIPSALKLTLLLLIVMCTEFLKIYGCEISAP